MSASVYIHYSTDNQRNEVETQTKAPMKSVMRPDTHFFGTLQLHFKYRTLYLHMLNNNDNVYATIDILNFPRGINKTESHHRMFW